MSKALAIASMMAPALMQAQESAPVLVGLDPPRIRIGEHAVISLSANAEGPAVKWPAIGDTITGHIEVIRINEPETAELDGAGGPAGARVVRRITITSFDTGYWAIPPFKLNVGERAVETEPLLLRVDGYPVGDAAVPADIKPIQRLSFSLFWWARQQWKWIAGAGLAVLLAAAAMLLVRRMRKAPQEPVLEAAPIALHERVLAALDALEQERLWQQGLHKPYQSRLTDLLRGYIEERYNVPALERTTDELMHELRVSPLSNDHQVLLGNMLHAADMVKFAKALPSPQENEQLMASARRFVMATAEPDPAHAKA
ncbi:MAG: hypothetical protein IPK70_12295 [Flavobacteriales bacterium]|jgi:hypothetical protein|nr:hypothetical protein [Flavobacteriales bacterium]